MKPVTAMKARSLTSHMAVSLVYGVREAVLRSTSLSAKRYISPATANAPSHAAPNTLVENDLAPASPCSAITELSIGINAVAMATPNKLTTNDGILSATR
jgi:hypothetical protein